jgi:AcrR family transcriptional regulator
MVRISKEYDERLNEFLDTAQQLFFEKGYQSVSVNHIIEKVGVAKGTFYHYFKTKADLLDKLVERFTKKVHGEIKKLVERTDLGAIEKLKGVFALGREIKAENVELMKLFLKALYNEDNLVLRHKMIRSRIKATIPEFARIIEQGNEEGTFHVDDPPEVAELIYLLAASLNEIIGEMMLTAHQHPENFKKIDRKIKAYEGCFEKILGLAPGSINIADPEYVKLFRMDNENEKGK